MRIFHYNDEEKELHRWLAERGHANTIVKAEDDPFPVVRQATFDAAFVGLHPHGMRLIAELHAVNPECLVTIITADRNTRRAVEAMRAGAFDYLMSPPLDFSEVERTYILVEREKQQQVQRLRIQDQLAAAGAGTRMIGVSEPVQNLRRLIVKAAQTKAPALLTGETGTGKEMIARLLHEQGPRAAAPFVAINCNAIPATLLESELFGHAKGTFTGADRDRPGLLANADGGTFFLDEIHDLELPLQGKLLRALQEEEIRPVGGRTTQKLNVRFVAATNQDLPQLVAGRKFRQDLYYRLNVVPILVPPLRERAQDIAILARYFIDMYSRREGRKPLKISPAVWRWMDAHSWPGNIRELENLCQRAVALADGETFDTDVLALTHAAPQAPNQPRADAATAPIQETKYRGAHESLDRELLARVLAEHRGNVVRAAKALHISRTTLYAKARKLGVRLPSSRDPAI
ncbi:MAG TPA: sigma-54 dependent transcriptional regulator [Tepidisphaeraceae bacterium]|nr:sigma-54 dependent transcriptional regulator [Tepidisphaeraceae bacterium]